MLVADRGIRGVVLSTCRLRRITCDGTRLTAQAGAPASLVAEETVQEMALGVRQALSADFGVAVSGIAGPGGGTLEKPVGLVADAVGAQIMEAMAESN